MSGMNVSGVGTGTYYQNPTVSGQTAGKEQQALADALRKRQESQPSLAEMMKDAREKAAKRENMFKLPKNSQRYGDAVIMAYSRLTRAKNAEQVDAASGYARRQIAQLRAAKRSDSDNSDRIQAAINQLQKAVNRAGRKKRELNQEKIDAKRQAKLEKEKRAREAKRLRHHLRHKQAMRIVRESSYLKEAEMDNRMQNYLAAMKQEISLQLQPLSNQVQTSVDAAIQQYASALAEPAPAPEISVQA